MHYSPDMGCIKARFFSRNLSIRAGIPLLLFLLLDNTTVSAWIISSRIQQCFHTLSHGIRRERLLLCPWRWRNFTTSSSMPMAWLLRVESLVFNFLAFSSTLLSPSHGIGFHRRTPARRKLVNVIVTRRRWRRPHRNLSWSRQRFSLDDYEFINLSSELPLLRTTLINCFFLLRLQLQVKIALCGRCILPRLWAQERENILILHINFVKLMSLLF